MEIPKYHAIVDCIWWKNYLVKHIRSKFEQMWKSKHALVDLTVAPVPYEIFAVIFESILDKEVEEKDNENIIKLMFFNPDLLDWGENWSTYDHFCGRGQHRFQNGTISLRPDQPITIELDKNEAKLRIQLAMSYVNPSGVVQF